MKKMILFMSVLILTLCISLHYKTDVASADTLLVASTTKVSYKMVNDKKGVPIREKANTSAKTLITVGQGLIVEDIGKSGKWTKIKYGKTTGYVLTSKLNATKATSGKTINKNKIDVKNTPTKNGTVVGQVSGNSTVTIYGTGKSWAYIVTSKVNGYIDLSSIDLKKNEISISDRYYPNCNKTYNYNLGIRGEYIVFDCKYGHASWEGFDDLDFDAVISIKGNELTYLHYEDSATYKFPFYKGKKWVDKGGYTDDEYEILSINETFESSDYLSGWKETFKNVVKIKVTSVSNMEEGLPYSQREKFTYYEYFAKDIGLLYREGDYPYLFKKFVR